MNTAQILNAYRDRSWRFLAELQQGYDWEFVAGEREGPFVWDLEHRHRVLDCGNSGGVHSLGHRNREIAATLHAAIDRLDAGLWWLPTQEAIAFQDAIAETAPPIADVRTVLTPSSTDSIDLAVMFAFRATGRRRVTAFRHGYHGHGGFAALVTGSDAEGLLTHYGLPLDYASFFPEYGNLESLAPHIGPDCAAVLLEPMNYETFEPAPAGYLEGVAALCRSQGALLIIDETRTGLGRSGRFWMTPPADVDPDMLILGKGLGGGYYPVSALLARPSLYDRCMNADNWGYMSSMAGSPIGAIVATKVVELASAPDLLENVRRLAAAFEACFGRLCTRFADVYAPGWVRGGIAALGVRAPRLAAVIRAELLRRDVLCHSVSEIAPSVVKFFPCLNSDPAIVELVEAALADIAEHA